jgi:hypothetical protein
MAYLKDYEYFDENRQLHRIELGGVWEECYKCEGEGFIEYDDDDDCDDELDEYELVLSDEQRQIVKELDRQYKRLKWRYGVDKPVSIRDYWIGKKLAKSAG